MKVTDNRVSKRAILLSREEKRREGEGWRRTELLRLL
jgi:hypothetical protein